MTNEILKNIDAELDYLDDMAKRYEVFAKFEDIKSRKILIEIIRLMKLLNDYKTSVVYDKSFDDKIVQ